MCEEGKKKNSSMCGKFTLDEKSKFEIISKLTGKSISVMMREAMFEQYKDDIDQLDNYVDHIKDNSIRLSA